MVITDEIIAKTERLANIKLSEDEKKEYSGQLSEIINYVNLISEVDTEGVEPTTYVEDIKNVFRSDVPGESLPVSEIEKIAPQFEDGHFVVPKIIES